MAATKKLPVILVFGDLAALGMIVVTIVAWKTGTAAFLGAQGFLMYLFPVVLAIIAVWLEKRRRGVLSFREALKPTFGVMVLALILQVLFAWALVHYIDPGFGRALAPLWLEKYVAVYRRAGTPEPELQRMIADAKGSDPFSFGAMMFGLARNCMIGFVISAGIAAVVGQRIIKPGPVKPSPKG